MNKNMIICTLSVQATKARLELEIDKNRHKNQNSPQK